VIDGESLSIESLMLLGTGTAQIEISPEAWKRVENGRQVVDKILAEGKG